MPLTEHGTKVRLMFDTLLIDIKHQPDTVQGGPTGSSVSTNSVLEEP